MLSRQAGITTLGRFWFYREVIIRCVQWYLRFKLSFRGLAEVVAEIAAITITGIELTYRIRKDQFDLSQQREGSGRQASVLLRWVLVDSKRVVAQLK